MPKWQQKQWQWQQPTHHIVYELEVTILSWTSNSNERWMENAFQFLFVQTALPEVENALVFLARLYSFTQLA